MQPLRLDAVNPFTGKIFTLDDRNLKLVNGIGMYLEPSDPDFVPYPGQFLPAPTQKTKKHTMPKSDFMPTDDHGKASLFVLFRDNVGQHLTTLGIAANDADIVQQAADATRFRAIVDFCGNMQNAAQGWTAEKNYERDGGDSAPAGQTVPELPAGFPVAVPAGIVRRFRDLVKRLKAIKNYTPPIGQALGIEGTVQAGPDLAIIQAIIALSIIGNAVLISWGWQGFSAFLDMLELQVDRGDGKGFVFLTYDTTPNYTDTTPLPATPTKWKYRAIYRVGDAQVGQWSNTVEITVGG
ncbi:MAG: hypothetical protein ACKVY0_29450 [Prosthecobacter sp.]|uniref:hypothetical protein n=1 Tax=Prosthecobacter sp. TaxID=1965333 RepID=UPI003901DBE3